MAEAIMLEPDVAFIKEVCKLGGGDLKKCYQCATCSVVCPIAPENKPFPRKEMITASWGLKDRLVSSADIWLCHNCGDCTTHCPRGAKPGDVMGALRAYAITEYAAAKGVAKAVNDRSKLPLLLAIPAIWFAVLAFLTQTLGPTLSKNLGDLWTHGVPLDKLAHTNFISTWFIDLTFIPLALWVVYSFYKGLSRFIGDMHRNALAEGKTTKKEIEAAGFIQALVRVVPAILKHNKFTECTVNTERANAHMLVLFSFIGLFIVTSFAAAFIYLLHMPGPISQLNPVKWLANISGIALCVGALLLLKSRLAKTDQVSAFKDWALIGLVVALGFTGMLTEITRLAGWKSVSFGLYYLHLIAVFYLFAYLPFSKLAHLVYRTTAMAYAEYAGRGFKI
jgi:quinone-modifying oxidoreductase subunit QmoC